MTATVRFPSGPLCDITTGMVTIEWFEWFQNPDIISFTLASPLDPASGGTGLDSYTVGDLIYATDTDTLAQLHGVATGNALISGGVATAPAWGKIGLTTHVSGTLPVANGGTGATTLTSHGILTGNATSAISATAEMSNGQILVGQTSNAPLPKTVSGYATLDSAGAVTVTKVQGTATNNNAAAGDVGEYVVSEVLAGSAVGLTSTVAADVTSISLTAGDWDVFANIGFNGNNATTVDVARGSISATTATVDVTLGRRVAFVGSGSTLFLYAVNFQLALGPTRFSLASTTTIYLVGSATFAVNTCAAYGSIQARRVR